MAENQTDSVTKLRLLQESFGTQLPERLALIRRAWQGVQADIMAETPRNELYRLIHGLAGSAGTFGYHRLGERARQLETYLQQLDVASFSDTATAPVIAGTLAQLEALAGHGADDDSSSSTNIVRPLLDQTRSTMLVYLLEDDQPLAAEVVEQLKHFGYHVESFTETAAIIKAQQQRPATAFILDIELPEGPLAGTMITPQLLPLSSERVPLIFISARDDWTARLAALRAGGGAYFRKPLDISDLVEKLDQLCGGHETDSFRVLIVEDTALLAEHYAAVLEAAGMATVVINHPAQLLDTISAFGPDLILMDLYLPDCTGIEAAQIIHQHSGYRGLPIIYLSTESGLNQQLNALKMGGDDFLQKPVADAHLVAAISNRVQRFRGLNALMSCDGMTGLLNHLSLKQRLEHELAQRRRQGGGLALAMIDIDHFKSINDRYGHPMGDRVIKSLARLLSQRLRKSDTAGRYGGEEFALILPDTSPAAAHTLLEELRQSFAAITYASDSAEFSATFSAGITMAPPHADMGSLIEAADAALYEAKHQGRNRVVCDKSGAGQVLSTPATDHHRR